MTALLADPASVTRYAEDVISFLEDLITGGSGEGEGSGGGGGDPWEEGGGSGPAGGDDFGSTVDSFLRAAWDSLLSSVLGRYCKPAGSGPVGGDT